MNYNLNALAPTLVAQFQPPPSIPLNSKSTITVKCLCGTTTTLNYRALLRKWGTKPNYLCKSCHVKTYTAEPDRIAKFKQSFALIASTPEHKAKCSRAGKLAWIDPEKKAQLIEKIILDNQTNPKKAGARAIALEALRNKPWFSEHMRVMSKESTDKQRLSIDEFIVRAVETHGDYYDYSLVEYTNKSTNIVICCPIHGEFSQAPVNHWNGQGCKMCAYACAITTPHQLLIDMIPNDIIMETNNRDVISPKELDVWLPEYRVGIEINGEYWHGVRPNMTIKERLYKRSQHYQKANEALIANIRLYQFWASEVIDNYQIVQSIILNAIGLSQRMYARKCQVKIITDTVARKFFNNTHLQGHRVAAVYYALVLDDEIMCGLSLSKHKRHQWEIIRYANKLNMTVVGGFSRLLQAFYRDHNPTEIVTFADRRISIGNVYTKNGFELLCTTRPNYFYIKNNIILSRQKCQKHKLFKLLGTGFDDSLSEVHNMLNSGYIQVFDAGHYKFVKHKLDTIIQD